MEGLPQLFSDLYNKFLLRDFVGKIVPGGVLLFSLASMYCRPVRVALYLKRASVVQVAFVTGFIWILTLGMQSLSEYGGLWSYFPQISQGAAPEDQYCEKLVDKSEVEFCKRAMRVAIFMRGASESEQIQYERYVAIKEACGNLFAALILSLPAWLVSYLLYRKPSLKGLLPFRTAVMSVTGAALLFGVARMHIQHVGRQWMHADGVAGLHERLGPSNKVSGDTDSKGKKSN